MTHWFIGTDAVEFEGNPIFYETQEEAQKELDGELIAYTSDEMKNRPAIIPRIFKVEVISIA